MRNNRAFQIKFIDGRYGWTNFNYSNALAAIGRELMANDHSEFWVMNDAGKPTPYFMVERRDHIEPFCFVRVIPASDASIDGGWTPQEQTMLEMEGRGVPVMELVWPGGTCRVFYPAWYEHSEPKSGRVYNLFKSDCYSLVREHLVDSLGIDVPVGTSDQALEHSRTFGSSFIHSAIESYGLSPVIVAKDGDIILTADPHGGVIHMMVYIEATDSVLHHFTRRLSCIEKYDGHWKQATVGIYRKV